jgi:hypothetical protein
MGFFEKRFQLVDGYGVYQVVRNPTRTAIVTNPPVVLHFPCCKAQMSALRVTSCEGIADGWLQVLLLSLRLESRRWTPGRSRSTKRLMLRYHTARACYESF